MAAAVVLVALIVVGVLGRHEAGGGRARRSGPDRTSPPTLREPFVARNYFALGPGDVRSAGHVFVLGVGDRPPVLVTALHVFGPAGGLDRQLSVRELPTVVAVKCVTDPLYRDGPLARSGPALLLEGTAPASRDDVSHDFAMFELTFEGTPPLAVLPLSLYDPRPDDTLWLACQMKDARSLPAKLHPVRTIAVGPKRLEFLHAGTPDLAGTSGAPVLNGWGECVGVNIGGYDVPGRGRVGVGAPAASLALHLERYFKGRAGH